MEYESSSLDATRDPETNSICQRLVKFYKIRIIISRLVRLNRYFIIFSVIFYFLCLLYSYHSSEPFAYIFKMP